MTRHPIHNALGSQDPQHRPAPTGDLRPPGIRYHARAEAQTDGLRIQHLHLLLGLDLQRDLGLALRLPATEQRRVGRVRREVLVARQGGVGALGGDFACGFTQKSHRISTRFKSLSVSRSRITSGSRV